MIFTHELLIRCSSFKTEDKNEKKINKNKNHRPVVSPSESRGWESNNTDVSKYMCFLQSLNRSSTQKSDSIVVYHGINLLFSKESN